MSLVRFAFHFGLCSARTRSTIKIVPPTIHGTTVCVTCCAVFSLRTSCAVSMHLLPVPDEREEHADDNQTDNAENNQHRRRS